MTTNAQLEMEMKCFSRSTNNNVTAEEDLHGQNLLLPWNHPCTLQEFLTIPMSSILCTLYV